MTRINLVHPSQLTDAHLLAEYKELPRVFTAVRKHLDAGKTHDDFDIPYQYVLGKGHVTFFYDKVSWLWQRYCSLGQELRVRGFTLNQKMINSICDSVSDLELDMYGIWRNIHYTPTPEEIYLNMARLAKRSKITKVLDELLDTE